MDVPSQTHAIEDLLAHSSWLSALALQLIRDVSEAEEFVQETWLKALAKPPRRSVPIRPWLTRVLRNTVHEKWRGSGRRRDREERAARSEALPSTTEMIENVESQTLLARLVLELGEPYKSTVMLRYYEGLSAAEIARRMDIPAGTVRWRLSEGLNQLKDALDRRHGGDRLAWCSLLAPLVGADRVVTSSATGLATLTLGTLTMKSLLVICVAVFGAVFLKLGWEQSMERPEAGLSTPLKQDVGSASDVAPGVDPVTQSSAARESLGAAGVRAGEASSLASGAPVLEDIRILGRTVDERGQAVQGALLSKLTLNWEAEQSTDSDGRFDFQVKRPPYFGGASLWITAPGLARTKVRLELKADTAVLDLGDIVLGPGSTLRGRVQDEQGAALEGVEVLAMEVSERDSRSPFTKMWVHHATAHTLTDEHGEFVLTGVPLGFVDVWAQKQTLLSDSVRGVRLLADGQDSEVELTLREIPDDAVITGIVLDMDGEPVPHAQLNISRVSERGVWSSSTSADRDGLFRLEQKIDGPVTIEAMGRRIRGREGFEHHRDVLEMVEPGSRDLVLKLSEPRWIEIIARDERGRVVRVDSIKVFRQARSGGGRTSRSAFLRVEDGADSTSMTCPLGTFGLAIDKVGYRTVELDFLVSEHIDEGVEVQLEKLAVLTGTVSGADGPVEGAAVQLFRVVGQKEEYVYERFPVVWCDIDRHGTLTDGEGGFVLPVHREELDQGDTYVLRASAQGRSSSLSGAFILDGLSLPDEFEFELTAGGSIEGRVMLPDGATPAGTFVGASCGDETFLVQTVGSDGAFRFDHLRPGNWFVQRMDDEYGFGEGFEGGSNHAAVREPIPWSCRVAEGEVTISDIDLRYPTTARLTGQLLIDGEAPGPWKVTLKSLVHRSRLVSAQVPGATALELDGSFELEGVPPGEYVLSIVDGSWDRSSMTQTVSLIPGDQSVQIELFSAPLSGRIDRELIRERLVHVHETASGVTMVTPISPDTEGAFETRVPVGAGRILTGKTFQLDKATLLLELDTPLQGAAEIDLK